MVVVEEEEVVIVVIVVEIDVITAMTLVSQDDPTN